MRIRTIKPEFWRHPVMGRLPDDVKTMALGLLNYADDHGYFEADPMLVRAQLRPFDDESTTTQRLLDECSRVGWIELKMHEKRGLLGHVVNFSSHQVVDRAKPSKLETYWVDEQSTTDRRLVTDPSPLEQGNREQGNREGIVKGNDDGAGKLRPASRKKVQLADADWVEELSQEEACRGIDVPRELAKMQAWCKQNGKHPTRRRFTNWLNRADRTIQEVPVKAPGVRPDALKSVLTHYRFQKILDTLKSENSEDDELIKKSWCHVYDLASSLNVMDELVKHMKANIPTKHLDRLRQLRSEITPEQKEKYLDPCGLYNRDRK